MAHAVSPTDDALVVEELTFTYARGRPALEDVGLRVPGGSFTALLGPNGAGKTTLMSLITRLFHSPRGRITVCGADLRAESRAALSAMGVVFQRPTLDLDHSVEQNLRYAAALQGVPRRDVEVRIGEALARLAVGDRRRAKARSLSGGLRRRVEVARALLHRPRLLVLDEPTVGLDIDTRAAIVGHVHELCRQDDVAALWATHLIDEIWPDDRVVVLSDGRVRAEGSLDRILEKAGCERLVDAYARLAAPSP